MSKDMKLIMETFKGKVNEKTTAQTSGLVEPLMDSIQILQMVAKAIQEGEVRLDSDTDAGREFDHKAKNIARYSQEVCLCLRRANDN